MPVKAGFTASIQGQTRQGMWVLEAQSFGSNDERSAATQTCKHYLTAGSHVVGRQIGQCAIVVEEDKSISRSHAVINVSYDNGGLCNVKGEHCRGAISVRFHCHHCILLTTSLLYRRQQPVRYPH